MPCAPSWKGGAWTERTGTGATDSWGHRGPRRADRKKKSTFHVTPAPASPRTALPQPPRIPVTGGLGSPPARLPQHTTPAASAGQPAAPDGGRACGLGVGAGQPAPLKGGTAEALPAMRNPLSVHTERSKCCAGDSFEPHECHRFSSAERWKGYRDRRSLPYQRSYGAREGSCSAVSKRTSPRGKSPNIWPLSRHIDTTPYSACSII